MKQTNIEMITDILTVMPREKKIQLHKACYRNYLLTSTYGLEFTDITIYKEGWYIEMKGTRSNFKVWAGDNDGEFVFGRKPKESSLHKIWSEHDGTDHSIKGSLEDYTINEDASVKNYKLDHFVYRVKVGGKNYLCRRAELVEQFGDYEVVRETNMGDIPTLTLKEVK